MSIVVLISGRRSNLFAHNFLDETGQQLVCVTHGARFNVSDGVCTQGPCVGDKLRVVEIDVEGADVVLRPTQLKE